MQRVLIAGPVAWNLMIHLESLPRPEPHMVIAERHHEAVGGTSAGKALNLRRLGVPVTLLTVVGEDSYGRRIVDVLSSAGVEVVVTPSGNGSERHTNLMSGDGERLSIFLNVPVPVRPVAVSPAALDSAAVVVADLAEHSLPVLRAARAAGKQIWCDLHDYDGVSEFHREFLDAADCVFVSSGRLADPEAFLAERVAAGARLAVCTMGAEGALALRPGASLVRVPAERVPAVVDTNGAGDAFFAGVLAGHLRGVSLEESLRDGARAAAAAVQSPGLAGS
ncbi:carbohydrate kinase family protein [Actinoplanes sp. NPDC051861]|uniref:carbohydrate kinase family protein n=1 Tax=Actinoplanes sp. NPDC051861 TaxID=3155170 RepID=UPI00343261AE